VGFHVYADASLLTLGAMLSQNVTGKSDQPLIYASRFLNKAKHNYSTTKRKALAMVSFFHNFRHYLLGNKFFLCRLYGLNLIGQQTIGFKENNYMVVIVPRI
jgi:hypothetical protein